MTARFPLPAAAVALTLALAAGGCAQDLATSEVRPAQMPSGGPCDDLLRAVEAEMPSAVGLRVHAARADINEARELCNSGQEEEGRAILRGVLGSVHEGG